jgi:hypothetical protein
MRLRLRITVCCGDWRIGRKTTGLYHYVWIGPLTVRVGRNT